MSANDKNSDRAAAIHANDCPTFQEFWQKHALPSKAAPSCLLCGAPVANEQRAIQHAELPNIFICACCVEKVRHPEPASATRPTMDVGEIVMSLREYAFKAHRPEYRSIMLTAADALAKLSPDAQITRSDRERS